ncbi:MAG: hypothetical protein JWN46_590 [Acidimicrobiales bacterium]|nr:hypothetical protein [Acidimicrobiales bacterium]
MSTHTRAFGALAFTAASLVAASPTASATPAPVALTCRAKVGPVTKQLALKPVLDVQAPASVAQGGAFQERIKIQPVAIPKSLGGITINDVRAVTIQYRVARGANVVKAAMAGPGASVAVARSVLTVTAAGPFAGGAQAALPDVVIDLKATGKPGSAVDTVVGGSSFAKPALAATIDITQSRKMAVAASCYASPKGQRLASVKITGPTATPKPGGHKPGGHKPKPGGPKPGGHKPGGHKPGGHKPHGHKPGGHKPGGHGHKPGGHKPHGHKPHGHKPGGHKPGHGPKPGPGPQPV